MAARGAKRPPEPAALAPVEPLTALAARRTAAGRATAELGATLSQVRAAQVRAVAARVVKVVRLRVKAVRWAALRTAEEQVVSARRAPVPVA